MKNNKAIESSTPSAHAKAGIQSKPAEVGPNGSPIGYTNNGDKTEWIRDKHSGQVFPLILRRSDKAIKKAYDEHWEKVWWQRHQLRMEQIRKGKISPPQEQMACINEGIITAKKIEKKYGRENLMKECETGLLDGRMSALAWVLGTDWDQSLDT